MVSILSRAIERTRQSGRELFAEFREELTAGEDEQAEQHQQETSPLTITSTSHGAQPSGMNVRGIRPATMSNARYLAYSSMALARSTISSTTSKTSETRHVIGMTNMVTT